jgi:hypothetical protein
MPIDTIEEYNKVLDVSWYNPEKDPNEQKWVAQSVYKLITDPLQIPLCPAILTNVSSLLHWYP